MISKKEVKHIAELARISLSAKEVERFAKELSSILDYVAKMNEADTEGVAPASHFLRETLKEEGGVVQIRGDEAEEEREEVVDALLEQMPFRKGRFLKVKKVFKDR